MTAMCWQHLEDANPGLLAYTMRVRPECFVKGAHPLHEFVAMAQSVVGFRNSKGGG